MIYDISMCIAIYQSHSERITSVSLREIFGCNHDPTDIDLQSIPIFSEDKVLISYTYNFKCPVVKFRVRWALRSRVTQTILLRLPILSSFYLLRAYTPFVNASISRLASLSLYSEKWRKTKKYIMIAFNLCHFFSFHF